MFSNNNNNIYDVLVIGAGASGLSAGQIFRDNGLSYKIIEGRDRIGGRVYSTDFHGI